MTAILGSIANLDRSGHFTFAWTEENDADVQAMIQKKMDAGILFFMRKPFGDEEIKLSDPSVLIGRELHVHDEDIAKLLSDGKVSILSRAVTALSSAVSTLNRQVTNAREAARSHTYAVRPFSGG